jgi:hypothetical protein
LAQAEAMARHLVKEHWPAIERAAAALAEEGELSGVSLDRPVDAFSVALTLVSGNVGIWE